MKTSIIYRNKARHLRRQGDECLTAKTKDGFYDLAKIWEQMAVMAEQRERDQWLGDSIESLNTGKKYLTSIVLMMI